MNWLKGSYVNNIALFQHQFIRNLCTLEKYKLLIKKLIKKKFSYKLNIFIKISKCLKYYCIIFFFKRNLKEITGPLFLINLLVEKWYMHFFYYFIVHYYIKIVKI